MSTSYETVGAWSSHEPFKAQCAPLTSQQLANDLRISETTSNNFHDTHLGKASPLSLEAAAKF
jgi:hypothetical protein